MSEIKRVQRICGSRPVIERPSESSCRLRESDEGQWLTVPDGAILVLKEHGDWSAGNYPGVRRQFPAGTRFRLVRAGSPHWVSITDVERGGPAFPLASVE